MKLLVCTMKRSSPFNACGNRGGEKIYTDLRAAIQAHQLAVEVEQIKCLGYCEDGPNISAQATGKLWSRASDATVDDVIAFCKQAAR